MGVAICTLPPADRLPGYFIPAIWEKTGPWRKLRWPAEKLLRGFFPWPGMERRWSRWAEIIRMKRFLRRARRFRWMKEKRGRRLRMDWTGIAPASRERRTESLWG